ncbi:MAG TPA: transcriptional regulator [Aliidongia sp.]|nr:transcriptional regulator [Aliidongia sp.]
MIITGAQIRMARAALRLQVSELARRAGVRPNDITEIEADLVADHDVLAAIQQALEAAGARFTGIGVEIIQDPT